MSEHPHVREDDDQDGQDLTPPDEPGSDDQLDDEVRERGEREREAHDAQGDDARSGEEEA